MHLMMEREDWASIEEVSWNLISAVSYSTIMTVKPLLHKFLWKILNVDDDSTTLKKIKRATKGDLLQRYQSASVQRIMNIATYLIDPRYNQLPFLDEVSKEKVISGVKDKLLKLTISEIDQEKNKKPSIKFSRRSVWSTARWLWEFQLWLRNGVVQSRSPTWARFRSTWMVECT